MAKKWENFVSYEEKTNKIIYIKLKTIKTFKDFFKLLFY